MDGLVLSVSDFVAVLNQTLEFAYPNVTIHGELANFRVSKNRWVYFDLKDELASVKFFGTVYQLPGPLEDGMTLEVRGAPRLHPQYGFSVTAQSIRPVGEGTIRRAAALLEAKLRAEGLFDVERKRSLSYPPGRIGLIASSESAAYADFVKILNERWGGLDIELADVQVQGEAAPAQIIRAIEYFNQGAVSPEVLVLTRGGGSPEDLAAFSAEQVTRAVASSRIPTLVAIGHESDISLAELAADKRASTPSNAAEALTPDKRQVLSQLQSSARTLTHQLHGKVTIQKDYLHELVLEMEGLLSSKLSHAKQHVDSRQQLLEALSPQAALRRGYALLRAGGKTVRSGKELHPRDKVLITLSDAQIGARVEDITLQ